MTEKERMLLLMAAKHLELVLGDLGRTAGLSEAAREVEAEQAEIASRAWGRHD